MQTTSVLTTLALLISTPHAMAVDLTNLWNFGEPAASEARFREAMKGASQDDAFILQTQIARTYGLRKDFDTARRVLREIEPKLDGASPEARVRYHLELGRTFASATHDRSMLDQAAKAQARQAYELALAAARAAKLDALTIDAIHMFAFLDTSPDDQLKWNDAALQVAIASNQADAKRWEASVRNNLGYALGQLGRHEEALGQFQKALSIRELGTNAEATRVARWMVGNTLRNLRRFDEALDIQLQLEAENAAVGKPDPYVFEELAALFKAKGEPAKSEMYEKRRADAAAR
jgi:tetratricopeptide (TPR) repeat protein